MLIFVEASVCREHEIIVTSRDNDHFAITAFVLRPLDSPKGTYFNRRTIRFDKGRIGDPACDNDFLARLNNFRGVPYCVDSTSHYHILSNFLRESLEAAYPKLRAIKKKE